MPHHRLLSRYWLLVIAAIALLAGTLLFANRWLVNAIIEQQEQVLTSTQVRQFSSVMSERLNNLEVIAKDWGFWDDTYQFMLAANPNEEAYQDNLTDDSLNTLQIDLFALLTPDGQVHTLRLRQDDNHFVTAEPAVGADLARQLPKVAELPATGRVGLIQFMGQPAEVAITPVLNSQQQGPSHGWLIFLRQIDHRVLARISHQLELPVDIRLSPQSTLMSLADIANIGRFDSRPLSDKILNVSLHFSGINGDQAFAVTLLAPRQLRATAEKSAGLLFTFTIAISVLCATLLGIGVNRLLVTPLLERIQAISRVDLESRDTRLSEGSSLTELVTLSRSVNHLLSRFSAIRQELRLTLAAVGDGVITLHRDGRIVYANPAAVAMLGLPSAQQVAGKNLFVIADICRSDHNDPHPPQLLLDDERPLVRQLWCHHRDGGTWFLEAVLSTAPGLQQKVLVLRDVTQQELATHSLKDAALRDPLTGLLNRRAFGEALNQACANFDHQQNCLLMIDLDHFKPVNDRFGHAAGDAALIAVANVLRGVSRAGDSLARLGGDEFAVILFNCNISAAGRVAELMRGQICAITIPEAGGYLAISASIGLCAITADDPHQITTNADRACYTAKAQGRNCTIDFHNLPPEQRDY